MKGRERGDAMVELKRVYERAGFELSTRELPDYLPVVLEYVSCRDLAETKDILSDCAHILKKLAAALLARNSAYAAVLQALLVIAGEEIVDANSLPPASERPESSRPGLVRRTRLRRSADCDVSEARRGALHG